MQRNYEGLPSDLRAIVDDGFQSIFDRLRAESFGAEACDEAERLVDAITDYVLASNPSFRGVTHAAAIHYNVTGEYTAGCGPA